MPVSLDKGLWVPQIQSGWVTAKPIASGNPVKYLPTEDPTTQVQDSLSNNTDDIMIVREVSWNVGPPDGGTTGALQIEFFTNRSDGYQTPIGSKEFAFALNNHVSKNLKYLASPHTFVWELASAYRLGKNEVLSTRFGGGDTAIYLTYSDISAPAAMYHNFTCVGEKTGRIVNLSGGNSSSTNYRASHKNIYEEGLLVKSLSIQCTNPADYPIGRIRATGQASWSRVEQPLWAIADPYPWSRLSFGRFQEGGMILKPNEGFSLRVKNHTSADIEFIFVMEAYIPRSANS